MVSRLLFSLAVFLGASSLYAEFAQGREANGIEQTSPKVTDEQGKDIPSVLVFWFAWQAFYPTTELWQNGDAQDG